MRVDEVVESDFLILGGGVAGCMAAIRAHELDPTLRVVVLEKAEISRSGAAGRGMDALNNVVIPGVGTSEEYVEAIEIVADGILDPTISQVIAERSFGILRLPEGRPRPLHSGLFPSQRQVFGGDEGGFEEDPLQESLGHKCQGL